MKPLAIDIFCGLGGWTEGLLAEGWDVIGFDIEQHVYGDQRYPAQLVLQDVCTLHGKQFKDASLIVASSPCQEFSYRAMPWKRAKALGPPELGMHLFAQAARIQREACEAAGRYIPMIQENVRGAQRWVGRAQWHYGSYYLWGDVPALMPTTIAKKSTGSWFLDGSSSVQRNDPRDAHLDRAMKNESGGSRFAKGPRGETGALNNARDRLVDAGRKNGGDWFSAGDGMSLQRRQSSGTKARKAATAQIAKIPLPLARFIAMVYYPRDRANYEGHPDSDRNAIRAAGGA